MGLTDSLRKVQQFKELDWRGLLKTCDILLEQSGKARGLLLEQYGKKHVTYYLNSLARLNSLTNLMV